MMLPIIVLCALPIPLHGWLFFFDGLGDGATRNVCYDGVGCFGIEPPFDSAGGRFPDSPDEIGVKLYHYFPDVRYLGNYIKNEIYWRDFRLPESYNLSQPITVLIHGYNEDMRRPHLLDLLGELSIQGTMNVVMVDWGEGAHALYDKSVANCRVVAAVVTVLLQRLFEESSLSPESVHLIGYSLGAHIAAYIGQDIPGIARITALDPAGPLFQNTPLDVRLDASDATFVDVIHTNGAPLFRLGFGMAEPLGHADFYPNGGKHQPGCSSTWDRLMSLITGSRTDLACSHRRAVELFTESINSPCEFLSDACSYDSIKRDYCSPCNGEQCVVMGYHVNTTIRGTFFLTTNHYRPFCTDLDEDSLLT